MRRIIALGLLCALGRQLPLRAETPGAALVPGNTKLQISIPNFEQFEKAWKKTKVSKLFDDSKLKPFFDDLMKESVLSKLAIDWDDVRSMAKGELSVAAFPVGPREAAHVMTLYTNSEKIPLMKVLAKVVVSMEKQGYKVGKKDIGGYPITTYTRDDPEGKKRAQYLFSFTKDEMLVAGDNEAAVAAVLDRLGRKPHRPLGPTKGISSGHGTGQGQNENRLGNVFFHGAARPRRHGAYQLPPCRNISAGRIA